MEVLMEGFFSGAIPFDAPSLAPLLFEAASNGDKVASTIVDVFASRWIHYAKLALQLASINEHILKGYIVLSGGVFKFDKGFLKEAIMQYTKNELPTFSVHSATFEPVGGAALFLFRKIYDKAKLCEISKKFSFSYWRHFKKSC